MNKEDIKNCDECGKRCSSFSFRSNNEFEEILRSAGINKANKSYAKHPWINFVDDLFNYYKIILQNPAYKISLVAKQELQSKIKAAKLISHLASKIEESLSKIEVDDVI